MKSLFPKALVLVAVLAIMAALLGHLSARLPGIFESTSQETHKRVRPSEVDWIPSNVPPEPSISNSERPTSSGVRQSDLENASRNQVFSPSENRGLAAVEPSPAVAALSSPNPELVDPWARIALKSVGLDEEATAYWLGAINDPGMPPDERKDLIEDLNEDGFADPEHPSIDELPLILARLALLEYVSPSPMDQVNDDAMAEAYKDLVAMADGLTKQ